MRFDGKTATCPKCGSVAITAAKRDAPNSVLRCDRCLFEGPRQRFVASAVDDRRYRAPTIGGRVLPILSDD